MKEVIKGWREQFEVEIPWDKKVVKSGFVIYGDLVFSLASEGFIPATCFGAEVKNLTMVIRDSKIPDDFESPDWVHTEKIHDWKNYVPETVQDIWNSFTTKQKTVLAMEAYKSAMAEDWD